jgi:hypothetical protein
MQFCLLVSAQFCDRIGGKYGHALTYLGNTGPTFRKLEEMVKD